MTPTEAAKLKALIDQLTDAPTASPNGPALAGFDTSRWTPALHEPFASLDFSVWDTVFPWNSPSGTGSSLPPNHEAQWYINHRAALTAAIKPWSVANGILTLTADRTPPDLLPLLGYDQPDAHTLGSYPYTSGLLHTRNAFSQTYGYFECEAQLPAGRGLWPAFWLLPVSLDWPPEIDIFEVLGHEPDIVHTTIHTPGVVGNPTIQAWVDTTKWHRYGLLWQPDVATLFIDGAPAGGGKLPVAPTVSEPMYILLNLAVGGPGSWPGPPDASTVFPASMHVRNVRVWQLPPA